MAEKLEKEYRYGVFIYAEYGTQTECISTQYVKTKERAKFHFDNEVEYLKSNSDDWSGIGLYVEVWERPKDDLWGNEGSPIYQSDVIMQP